MSFIKFPIVTKWTNVNFRCINLANISNTFNAVSKTYSNPNYKFFSNLEGLLKKVLLPLKLINTYRDLLLEKEKIKINAFFGNKIEDNAFVGLSAYDLLSRIKLDSFKSFARIMHLTKIFIKVPIVNPTKAIILKI